MKCAGIDAGSRAVKVVLWDSETGHVLGSGISDQGVQQSAVAEQLLSAVLADAGVNRAEIDRIVATGYGRDAIDSADTTITEITCHARGVRNVFPGVRTVIDIGGQDSKLIRLDGDGKVRDFVMNDRCAAGTGRFLEVVSDRLGIQLSDLAQVAAEAGSPAPISSMCVVFAETEIIGLLAAGESRGNIVAGVQNSIASRIASMAGRALAEPVVFTGGVALVPGMPGAVEAAIGCRVTVPDQAQFTGALGAALLAAASK